MKTITRILPVLLWIAVFEGVGALLGLITQENIPSWYAGLNKSSLTPPTLTFSLVWPILYALIAYVGYAIWQQAHSSLFRLYVLNIFFNWMWTPLFFYLHWIGFSFAWIIFLTLLTFIITLKLNSYLRYLFLPYFFWLLFASYLNGVIWLTN